MKKLWGGRFSAAADDFAEAFGASISFDHRFAPYDIQGSIAHVTMLGTVGIVTAEDASKIARGLRDLLSQYEREELEFSPKDEDIHMNIERHLTARIGPVAGKLHTARSRNDQVALDFHLFVREQLLEVAHYLERLQGVLIEKAATHLDVVMPGYTHLQRAQPVLFSHHLLAYAQMCQRDTDRLRDLWKRVNVMPLGAGALAGTTFPIDRHQVAQLLHFDAVYENSMDAVSDRDFALEFLNCLATIMMHLSRLCEEIVVWCTGEFGFIELHDSLATGSSMMPQKKNPDFAELIRGKTGRVYGSLLSLYTVMKGLPLTYNKDMQEDKECVFDSLDTVLGSLRLSADMIRTCKVNSATMRQAASAGFTNATDVADYLSRKGLPFRDAHEVVGHLVRYCLARATELDRISLAEYKQHSTLFEEDIYDAIKLEAVVARRSSYGGTGPAAVEQQLDHIRTRHADNQKWVGARREQIRVK